MSLISMDFAAADQCADAGGPSRQEDDLSYHLRRAEEELRIAPQSELPAIRRFHYHLAALHLDRAHSQLGAMRRVA